MAKQDKKPKAVSTLTKIVKDVTTDKKGNTIKEVSPYMSTSGKKLGTLTKTYKSVTTKK